MATKNIVPRGDGEGGLGSSDKAWGESYFKRLYATETLLMPLTTTANRPASAEIGATMFDTDIGALIIWDGTGWIEAGGASPTTLNVVADPSEGGSVSGGGTHDKNTDAVIEATPNPEWTFAQWEGNVSGLDGGNVTANPTFVSMTQSWSIRAKFLINQYTLTAQAGTGGSTTGTGDYDFGSYGTITAVPYPEYDFVNWTGGSGGDIIAPNNEITTVLVDQDKTVTANFALKTYDVTVNHLLDIDGSGTYNPDTNETSGTVIGSATGVDHGTVHPVSFSPNPGYQIVGWELDSASNTLQTISYDVVGATSDNTILTFEKSGVQSDNPNISIETGDTLLINNNASSQPSSFNDTFMLNDGSASGTYTIVANDPGPQDIVITFDGSTDLATLIANGADGAGTTPYPVTINSGDGGAIGMAAQSITITGGTNVFTLNIKDSSSSDVATESGGVLTLGVYDDAETYTYYSPEFPGDLGTITISDGFADSSSASTTTTVTENRTINLRTSIQTYSTDITVADFDYQGTPEVPGTVTIDSPTPVYGSSVTITATSSNSSKYEFDYWGGTSATLLTNTNDPSATIDSVEADIVLVANFKLKQYTLTIDSNLNSTNDDAITDFNTNLSVSGTLIVDYGTTGFPISYSFAAGSDNYLFDGWTNASDVTDSTAASTTLAVEVTGDLTVTANFSLKTVTAYFIIHDLGATSGAYQLDGSGAVNASSTSGGATVVNTTYDWALNINGTDYITGGVIATSSTGNTFDQYSNGTVSLGGTTVDAFSITLDAFSTLDVTTDFSNSQYGFASLNGHGTSSIFDSNDPNADVILVGTSLFSIQVGKKPNSNFIYENQISTDGNVYFGDTLTFYDVSTAPSSDGIVSSSTFSGLDNLGNPITFYDTDTGIRVFKESKNNPRNKPLTFNAPDRYGDPTQEWTIFIEAEDSGANQKTIFLSRGTLTLGLNNFLGNTSNNNWYFRNDGVNIGQNFGSATTYGGRMIIKCTPTLSQTITMLYRQKTGGIATRGNNTNSTGPATTGPLVIGGAAQDNADFEYIGEIGYNGWGALYKSIGLLPRACTTAEQQEFLGVDSNSPYTELSQLSYLSDFEDYYNLGSSSNASISGENSGNFDLTFAGEQSQFVSIASVDIPTGSSGDTTGSMDVTLTVTDDQGLTDTETQTISYTLPLLAAPEVTDAEIRLYEDSSKSSSILEAPIVTGVTASYVISGEPEIVTTTNSASGSELTNYTTITGNTAANTYSASTIGTSSLTSSINQNYYSS